MNAGTKFEMGDVLKVGNEAKVFLDEFGFINGKAVGQVIDITVELADIESMFFAPRTERLQTVLAIGYKISLSDELEISLPESFLIKATDQEAFLFHLYGIESWK